MSQQTYTPTHCPETGRKFTKAERKAANKAKYAAERAASKPKGTSLREAIEMVNSTAERHFTYGTEATAAAFEQAKANLRKIEAAKSKRKPKAKRKPTQAVRKPKRTSADGLEQAQARTATAQRVGKVQKTKVVHAVTGKEAQPFEPRMEVPVEERKQVKREQMRLVLLPGESPEQGIRRMKVQQAQAEAEAIRIEAEQLTMNFEA